MEEKEKAIEILGIFEDYLEGKGVKIPNEERNEYGQDKETELAILFGSDYYFLEDKIISILKEVKE